MKKILLIYIIVILSIISFSKVYVYKNNVVFEFKDLTASQVFLAGSFNNWDPTAQPMKKAKSGLWRVALRLAPGDYQYKFVINGTDWKEDPEAPDYVPDGYGGKNGSFSLVLENGKLKIKKPEKQESGILSGKYSFNLKSKVNMDTYSFKSPEITHNFYLTINPKKSGMNFEAVLNADNYSWQLGLNSLKATWENSNFKFGIYKNNAANDLITFNENIEESNSGFFGIVKTKFANLGVDLFSDNNNLNYFITGNIDLKTVQINALFLPETSASSMNIYVRAEANGFGIEGKYSDKLEYVMANYLNDNIMIKGIYDLSNKEIYITSGFNKFISLTGNYSLNNNAYNIESDISYGIFSESNILLDLYYDNFSNFGYKIGYGLKKDNIAVSFKLGNDFEKDFENYYFYISASSNF